MEIVSEGIAVFKNVFLRSEEVIDMAEESPNWRQGTAGQGTDPKVRITDMHDLDKDTELHGEILQTFVDGINDYSEKYKHCKIQGGEHLRIGRYGIGGHYSPHADAGASERTLSGLLYLNSDFKGGELNFPHQDLTITPEEGMLVLFPSNYIYVHQSMPLTEGKKWVCVTWFK